MAASSRCSAASSTTQSVAAVAKLAIGTQLSQRLSSLESQAWRLREAEDAYTRLAVPAVTEEVKKATERLVQLHEEKTKESFEGDSGWFKTGDVGVVLPNGSMKIIDRAKNIFKLSQGEYVAPEKVENVYIQSNYIGQVWVHGDSTKDYCVAFVVVAAGKIQEMDSTNADEFKKKIYDDMMRLAKDNKFNSLEKPKQIHVLKEPFTVEKD